jgi:hypothetical protein
MRKSRALYESALFGLLCLIYVVQVFITELG